MPKYALFTTILLLLPCSVLMAKDADRGFICLSSFCLSGEHETANADNSIFQTEFRGQSVCEYPPDEYYQFLDGQRPNRSRVIPATEDYDVRYSSNYCRPYWGEVFKDIVPVRSCDMRYSCPDEWTFQLLPSNIIYKSYMACGREPRLGIHFVDSMQPDDMSYWDCSIGARVSLLRFGSRDPLYPEGIELEMDACAFPRLGLNRARDLFSCDYRFAFPLVYRSGRWEYMFGYYHISSHLGDEYMVNHNSLHRYNYSRDCLMAGVGFRPNPAWRFYFHMEYAVSRDISEPWQFMFGVEYSPMYTGPEGAPFFAACGRLRDEIDFSGSFTLEAGWQWRNDNSHIFRMGLFYLNGYSDHYQFYNIYEKQIGFGIWYDF